jgi:hypothetical protein
LKPSAALWLKGVPQTSPISGVRFAPAPIAAPAFPNCRELSSGPRSRSAREPSTRLLESSLRSWRLPVFAWEEQSPSLPFFYRLYNGRGAGHFRANLTPTAQTVEPRSGVNAMHAVTQVVRSVATRHSFGRSARPLSEPQRDAHCGFAYFVGEHAILDRARQHHTANA